MATLPADTHVANDSGHPADHNAIVDVLSQITGAAPGGAVSLQTVMNTIAGGVTSGLYLRGNGTNVLLAAILAADLPAATTSTQGAVVLDGTVGDIAATPGTAAAGSVGKAADAGHVHPQPSMFAPTGLTGATSATRYVGSTASGAPASGTFAVGDFIVDRSGSFWVCTVAGSPGTWVQVSGGGVSLDGTAADIQPIGTVASAGNKGQAADAKHQHAWGQTAPASFAPANPANTVSTTLVMMGLGSTCALTPTGSGTVLVIASGTCDTATGATSLTLGGRYGTGTAPANGAAVSGTRFGGATDQTHRPASTSNGTGWSINAVLSLTPATAYWFDIALDTSAAADAASIASVSVSIVELP